MAILVCIVALFLLGSLLHLVLTYALRWYEITNQPRYWPKYGNRTLFAAGWHGLALFVQEYLLLITHLLILAADWLLWPYYYWRGERGGMISDGSSNTPPPQPGRNPVILLHGYMMRGGTLWLLRRRLRRDGRRVWLFNYGPSTKSITLFAQQLQEGVEHILAETRQKKVDLIGHSMGGLIILYYLNRLGGEQRVGRAITLGTPFSGTKLWAFSLGCCGSQMRPNSEFLQGLQTTGLSSQVRFTAIYSDFDDLVLPNESARADLPGAVNKRVSGIGHVGLLFSKAVYGLVKEALQDN